MTDQRNELEVYLYLDMNDKDIILRLTFVHQKVHKLFYVDMFKELCQSFQGLQNHIQQLSNLIYEESNFLEENHMISIDSLSWE